MAYTKTNWQNGVTPVNADNMNKIENELEALDQAGGGGTQLYKHFMYVGSDPETYYYLTVISKRSTKYTEPNQLTQDRILQVYYSETSFNEKSVLFEYYSDGIQFRYITNDGNISTSKSFIFIDSDTVTPL